MPEVLQQQVPLLHRTRRFFPAGGRNRRQYSLRRPKEGRPGWVGLEYTGMVDQSQYQPGLT